MTQDNNNLHFWYDAQNRPAIVEFNGTKYGYLYNLQGDVIGLIDSANTEVVKYTYDAWGKPLSVTGSLLQSLPLSWLRVRCGDGAVLSAEQVL